MPSQHYTPGLHLLLDLSSKNNQALASIAEWKDMIYACLESLEVGVVHSSEHSFSNGGFTAAICLKESHICIHTWPEFHRLSLDIFLCNNSADNTNKVEEIGKANIAYFDAFVMAQNKIIR